MGFLCTYNPAFSSCLSETGVFKRVRRSNPPVLFFQPPGTAVPTVDASTNADDEEFVDPNVRSAWSVRGGSMTLVQAGALYFGTQETYIVAMTAVIWREAYDTVDLFRYKKDAHKILLRI